MKLDSFTWSLYKGSERGKAAIKMFADAASEMTEVEIAMKYHERLAKYYPREEDKRFLEDYCTGIWTSCIECEEYEPRPQSLEEARGKYVQVIERSKEINEFAGDRNGYDQTLGDITWISFLMYYFAPDYFFPYLYQYQIFDFIKIVDTFGLELPLMPKKPNYKARCMYYWDLCEMMYHFRTNHDLSPAELCAFLYDFAPNYVCEDSEPMPEPSNVWMIGGAISEIDMVNKTWQGNAETKKGDIIVHYETTPVSAITCLWRSETDGVIDPFFRYHSNIYLCDQMQVPHVTIKELKNDAYFAQHPLVRKNLQGVNGYRLTSKDYAELQRVFADKGFDTTTLPRLYAPQLPDNILEKVDAEKEKGVEKFLIVGMLLEPMGLVENRDYSRQQPLQAGRKHEKYEDFAVGYREEGDEKRADCVIEAKHHIKNAHDFQEAFGQGASYARLLRAEVMCLADRECLYIFKDNKGFSRNNYKKVYWADLEKPDVFRELKKLMGK